MSAPQKYNPKSTSPAIFIPSWLAQVPTRLLSNNAKMLYGRLSQWCSVKGDVYRSLPQLSEELGTPATTLKRHLKELKDAKLIGTFHPQAGGVNHYEFYHHLWMDKEINKNLSYASEKMEEKNTPPRTSAPTPSPDVRHINKKEVRTNDSEQSSPPASTPSGATPLNLASIFAEELPASPQPVINVITNALDSKSRQAINNFKKYWHKRLDEPLTEDSFRGYLKGLKETCPGFLDEYTNHRGRRQINGLKSILNWENFEKYLNNTLF
tara:strand:+ start:21852 stop:22652 length:801 start_codon:yes stop_codon:yes gene_type:complete